VGDGFNKCVVGDDVGGVVESLGVVEDDDDLEDLEEVSVVDDTTDNTTKPRTLGEVVMLPVSGISWLDRVFATSSVIKASKDVGFKVVLDSAMGMSFNEASSVDLENSVKSKIDSLRKKKKVPDYDMIGYG